MGVSVRGGGGVTERLGGRNAQNRSEREAQTGRETEGGIDRGKQTAARCVLALWRGVLIGVNKRPLASIYYPKYDYFL